jgi:hypothetical protein
MAGDWVRLEAGAGSLTGFELAIEDNGGIVEFLLWLAELGAKEDLGWPAPGERPSGPCLFRGSGRWLKTRNAPSIQ